MSWENEGWLCRFCNIILAIMEYRTHIDHPLGFHIQDRLYSKVKSRNHVFSSLGMYSYISVDPFIYSFLCSDNFWNRLCVLLQWMPMTRTGIWLQHCMWIGLQYCKWVRFLSPSQYVGQCVACIKLNNLIIQLK